MRIIRAEDKVLVAELKKRLQLNTIKWGNVHSFPVSIYLLKVNYRNTRTRCEICSKYRSGVFIINFEHISHLVLVFLLLTLSR